MPRLFIAIDFSESLRRDLVRLQPEQTRGIRLTTPEQLHLTLHFIGEADPDLVIAELKLIHVSEFTVSLDRTGSFHSRNGGKVLWVGLEASDELNQLHELLGDALKNVGIPLENRAFHPHITLARIKASASRSLIPEFGHQTQTILPIQETVRELSLYASDLTSAGPVYERLHSVVFSKKSMAPDSGTDPSLH